ncbi:MAG TPA: ABC transporter substrate-binding protein [Limnochordia bacterium]|nr:ABC transporter substrate-binding protein [Limnochordia bacterium]
MIKRMMLVLALIFSLATAAQAATFNGAWPYSVPPQGHYNTFVPNNISLGMYWDLLEQPLAIQYWSTGKWMPLLATNWELTPKDNPDTFRVHLRPGVKWQDGNPFTAKDVVDTFYLGKLLNWAVWQYIDTVTAVDDYTVDFHMAKPSSVVPRYVLREHMRSAAVYGKLADQELALIKKGEGPDSSAMKLLKVQLNQFRPERIVGTGPFVLDPTNLTEAGVDLTRWHGYWDDKTIQFDDIHVYNGETPTVTPLVLAKKVDYATHGFPPATEKQFVDEGIRIIRPPIYSGPALYVNYNIYPLNRKEVRQAIAYAVERNQNAVVSLGASAKPQLCMCGFSDNIVPLWLSKETQAKLNAYAYDPAKATQILQGIGFSKGADGIWRDDKGKPMQYELIVPQEYADWSAAAQNLAEQLTKFGIKVTVRGITYSQEPQEIWQGRFQMAIQGWGAGNPHPEFSFFQDLITYNTPGGQGPGMNLPLVQNTDSVGQIDLQKAVADSAVGLDQASQTAAVTRLSLAFNELLPIIPLWERFGNNPALDGVHVTNWPPEGDPIYTNDPYTDNFVTMLILDGTLKPAM